MLHVANENELKRPLNYHHETEQTLKEEDSLVAKQLKDVADYADLNELKINQKKTKLMLFNSSKTNDCQPEFKIDEVEIEVFKQMTDDLKWHENTTTITKKAFSRLWVLRRLNNKGASKATQVDFYMKQLRSVV